MRRVATAVAVGALCLTVVDSAAGSTTRRLGYAGYGASRWGQTVAQTEHALGVRFDCSGTSCSCPTASPALPITLAFSNARLVAAFTQDQSVRTARGIHVGSSLASVRSAYPHATRQTGPIGGGRTTYMLARGRGGVLAFELTGSTVSGLDAGPKPSSFSKELCTS